MILFTILVYYTNDGHLKFNYVICPETSLGPCEYWNNTNLYDMNAKPILLEPGEDDEKKKGLFGGYKKK